MKWTTRLESKDAQLGKTLDLNLGPKHVGLKKLLAPPPKKKFQFWKKEKIPGQDILYSARS